MALVLKRAGKKPKPREAEHPTNVAADRNVTRMAAAVAGSLAVLRSGVNQELLRVSLERNDPSSALDAFPWDRWARSFEGVVLPRIGATMEDAARLVGKATVIEKGNGVQKVRLSLEGIFNLLNPRAQRWASRLAARFVTRVETSTREAMRQVIADAQGSGAGLRTQAEELAQILTETAGLDGPRARALSAYRARLGAQGVPAGVLQQRVGQMRDQLLIDRAKVIARHETQDAANAGQEELWAQARDEGLLPRDWLQEWIATKQDKRGRTCPICVAMDGQRIPLGQLFHSDYDGSNHERPPAHIQCRCARRVVPPTEAEIKKYSESQPRDEEGKWTDGGDSRVTSPQKRRIPRDLRHYTDGEPRLSTADVRLIPNSMSVGEGGSGSAWGERAYQVEIRQDAKILRLDVMGKHGDFFNFGPEIATPVERGRVVFEFARDHGYQIVHLTNVPQVGQEFAVLDLDAVVLNPIRKYDPSQPRDPAGTATGGQWASVHGGHLDYSPDDASTWPKHDFGEQKIVDLWHVTTDASNLEAIHTAGFVPGAASAEFQPVGGQRVFFFLDREGADVFERRFRDEGWNPAVLHLRAPVRLLADLDPRTSVEEPNAIAVRPDRKLHDDFFVGVRASDAGAVPRAWRARIEKFDPNQPRHPAGHPEGGQWVGDDPEDDFDTDAYWEEVYQEAEAADPGGSLGLERNEATAYLDQIHASLKLNGDDLYAVEGYQDGAYAELNSDLREGSVSEEAGAMRDRLDGVIARAPRTEQPITVWRGTGSGRLANELRVGDVVTDKGYVSTTTSPTTARGFSEGRITAFGYQERTIMRIELPAGTQGVWMKQAIGDGSEQEFLLGRERTFKVTSVEQIDGASFKWKYGADLLAASARVVHLQAQGPGAEGP